jgi:hypothetical protein
MWISFVALALAGEVSALEAGSSPGIVRAAPLPLPSCNEAGAGLECALQQRDVRLLGDALPVAELRVDPRLSWRAQPLPAWPEGAPAPLTAPARCVVAVDVTPDGGATAAEVYGCEAPFSGAAATAVAGWQAEAFEGDVARQWWTVAFQRGDERLKEPVWYSAPTPAHPDDPRGAVCLATLYFDARGRVSWVGAGGCPAPHAEATERALSRARIQPAVGADGERVPSWSTRVVRYSGHTDVPLVQTQQGTAWLGNGNVPGSVVQGMWSR